MDVGWTKCDILYRSQAEKLPASLTVSLIEQSNRLVLAEKIWMAKLWSGNTTPTNRKSVKRREIAQRLEIRLTAWHECHTAKDQKGQLDVMEHPYLTKIQATASQWTFWYTAQSFLKYTTWIWIIIDCHFATWAPSRFLYTCHFWLMFQSDIYAIMHHLHLLFTPTFSEDYSPRVKRASKILWYKQARISSECCS